LWFVNISGMVLLAVLQTETAHKIVLPILWFLQVHRISDIATRENTFNTSLLVNSSYKPLQRIFASKIVASLLLFLFISSPLVIKYGVTLEFTKIFSIIIGFIILVFSSILFGQISKGKKLFEVTFFLVTYANINGIPFFDYFGAFSNTLFNINGIIISVILFLTTSILLKKHSLLLFQQKKK